MLKAFKIVIGIFLSIFLFIVYLYYSNHETNERIFNLTKIEVEQKNEVYLRIYNFLKSNTSDSLPSCAFHYKRGNSYISFSQFSIYGRDINTQKDAPTFVDSLGRTFSASINSNYEMGISIDLRNYKTDVTRLFYSQDLKRSIERLKKIGFMYFDTVNNKMEYENCIIKLNENWLLSFSSVDSLTSLAFVGARLNNK